MRWSHLLRHGLIGTSLVGAAASQAVAEPCDDIAARTVGFVIGFDIGDKISLIGGIEGRQCLDERTEAMVRLELGGGPARVIGGIRLRPLERRDEDADREHVGVELGVGVDTHSRFGMHGALTFGSHSAYAAFQTHLLVGHQPPARFSLLGGLAPWTAFESTVVEGRPLIHAGQMLRPGIAVLPAARDAEGRAVRDHYASSAQLELSSVWTFLRLAEELAAVGAPAALIAAALDAADDEVRHAELCAGAAGGVELWSLPGWVARPRFDRRSAQALAVLAREAWCEGCLNEGAAAEEARLAAAEAEGPARPMLAAIAADEARHAALSWAVLRWVTAVAPDVAAAALAGIPDVAGPDPAAPFDRALARHGVPSPEIRAAAWAETRRAEKPV